jgi:exosortase/archaeosortase family protein
MQDKFMNNKKKIKSIFISIAVFLMLLPLFSMLYLSLSSILTRLAESSELYMWLDKLLVPYQASLVKKISDPFVGYIGVTGNGFIINGARIVITWNCIGWQSVLLFLASLYVGLKGRDWTLGSKLTTIIFGIFGIFWVNIFRMSFIIILFAKNMSLFKIVFHDYLSAFVTVIWLMFFWWFSYRYLLTEKPHGQVN